MKLVHFTVAGQNHGTYIENHGCQLLLFLKNRKKNFQNHSMFFCQSAGTQHGLFRSSSHPRPPLLNRLFALDAAEYYLEAE